MPVVFALDPPHKQDQTKQPPKDDNNNKKKAEPAKKEAPPSDDRLDRRNSRMKERDQEIDGLLNKKK